MNQDSIWSEALLLSEPSPSTVYKMSPIKCSPIDGRFCPNSHRLITRQNCCRAWADLRKDKRAVPHRTRPQTSSRGRRLAPQECLENLLAVSSGPAGGAYSAPSQTPQLVGRTGCPRSRPFWASGFVPSASPLTRNRRLDPSKHDRLDPPILSRRLGPCDLGIIDDLIIYRCSKM